MTALAPDAEEALAALARGTPCIDVLMLFGSAAARRVTTNSDVDLYVRLAPGASFDREEFVARASEITRREIDLHVESARTSVILRREVAARGLLLFERGAGAHRNFVADAIRVYVDYEPQLRQLGAAVRERAKREGFAASARLRDRGAASGR